jgi:hypothetical protein
MLQEAAASYIAAQEAGDLSKMSLAAEVKYIEDMKETTKDKGLWNTALPIAFHRSIYDVGRCKTFSEVIVTEGGHPYVIGTRLKVEDGKVSEIDSLVTDEHDWLFNAENYLKYSKAEECLLSTGPLSLMKRWERSMSFADSAARTVCPIPICSIWSTGDTAIFIP